MSPLYGPDGKRTPSPEARARIEDLRRQGHAAHASWDDGVECVGWYEFAHPASELLRAEQHVGALTTAQLARIAR